MCQTRVPGLPGQKGEKGSPGVQGVEGLVGEKVHLFQASFLFCSTLKSVELRTECRAKVYAPLIKLAVTDRYPKDMRLKMKLSLRLMWDFSFVQFHND